MPLIEKLLILAVFGFGLLVCAVEILFLVDFLRYRRKSEGKRSKLFSKPAIIVHVIAAAGFSCFLYGFFIEPYRLEVNEFRISTDKLLNGTNLRIVHISDLHCDPKMRNEEKLVQLVNAANPDVIVFTGDAVNKPATIPLFRETVTGLKAGIAKLAVRGNWWSSIENAELFEGTGFKVLERDRVRLEKDGQAFCISGLNFWDAGSCYHLLRDVSAETFNIFLYHSPDLIEDITDHQVDVYFCGHTHGGQIALPFYGAVITFSKFGKKYESGLYHVGKTHLYVNRGVGMEGGRAPRARFFARPEIAIFDIAGEGAE